jgi:hypothetical protein
VLGGGNSHGVGELCHDFLFPRCVDIGTFSTDAGWNAT